MKLKLIRFRYIKENVNFKLDKTYDFIPIGNNLICINENNQLSYLDILNLNKNFSLTNIFDLSEN